MTSMIVSNKGRLGDVGCYAVVPGRGLLGEGTWRVMVTDAFGNHLVDAQASPFTTFVISEEAADEYIDVVADILGVPRIPQTKE